MTLKIHSLYIHRVQESNYLKRWHLYKCFNRYRCMCTVTWRRSLILIREIHGLAPPRRSVSARPIAPCVVVEAQTERDLLIVRTTTWPHSTSCIDQFASPDWLMPPKYKKPHSNENSISKELYLIKIKLISFSSCFFFIEISLWKIYVLIVIVL